MTNLATHEPPTRGTVEWLAPDDLKVDPRTQRLMDKGHVNRIARDFDTTLLGIIEVSRRPDGDYIVDGQHRCAAARKVGRGKVPIAAHVVEGLTVPEEAARFVGINSTAKRPNPMDRFRIRCEAQEPAALEIAEILDSFGLRIGYSRSTVRAIGAIERVYWGIGTPARNEAHPDHLHDTLDVIGQAFGFDGDGLHQTVVRGVGLFVGRYHTKLDKDRLIDRLSKSQTPSQLIGRARVLADASGVSANNAAAEIIKKTYNYKLSAGRIDP